MADVSPASNQADQSRDVLMGQSLRERAHELRRQACTAWSDVVVPPYAGLDEAKGDLARALEDRLRGVIDELADLACPPVETRDDYRDDQFRRAIAGLTHMATFWKDKPSGHYAASVLEDIDAKPPRETPAVDGLDRGCFVIMELMQAYERRIRSDCTTPEQLAAEPWRCAEYIKAERYLVAAAEASKALDAFLAHLRQPQTTRAEPQRPITGGVPDGACALCFGLHDEHKPGCVYYRALNGTERQP